jgi:hypothetical protein
MPPYWSFGIAELSLTSLMEGCCIFLDLLVAAELMPGM